MGASPRPQKRNLPVSPALAGDPETPLRPGIFVGLVRTNFLSVATERACSLRAALLIGERELIAELETKQLSPGQVSAFLREMVRRAVVGMLEAQDAPVAPELPEMRLATLETQQAELRDTLRRRNWTPARAIAAPTAPQFGLTDEDLEQPSLARQLLTAQLRVLELEAQVEEAFDDPLHLGKALLETHGLPATREGLRAPMRLSEAIEKASQAATDDVAKKIETIGKLALFYLRRHRDDHSHL